MSRSRGQLPSKPTERNVAKLTFVVGFVVFGVNSSRLRENWMLSVSIGILSVHICAPSLCSFETGGGFETNYTHVNQYLTAFWHTLA
jgi:hypothetical protein